MIGKEWFFVRVHDAVQVCLQHVQSIKEMPTTPNPPPEERPSLLQRLLRQTGEDLSIPELESGNQRPSASTDTDPQLEQPLLPRKP